MRPHGIEPTAELVCIRATVGLIENRKQDLSRKDVSNAI